MLVSNFNIGWLQVEGADESSARLLRQTVYCLHVTNLEDEHLQFQFEFEVDVGGYPMSKADLLNLYWVNVEPSSYKLFEGQIRFTLVRDHPSGATEERSQKPLPHLPPEREVRAGNLCRRLADRPCPPACPSSQAPGPVCDRKADDRSNRTRSVAREPRH